MTAAVTRATTMRHKSSVLTATLGLENLRSRRVQGAMRGSIVGGTPLIAPKFPTQQSHFLAASRHGSDERNPAVGSGHQVKEADMAAVSILLSRQSQRLLQIGVALLLLLSLEGLAIPHLAAPHLGVSAHKLAALQSVLLLALGLVWPKLNLSAAISRIAFWLFIYAAFAILAAFVIGAIWGAGNETMPLAAGTAHGTAFQETVIRFVAYSSAPTGLVSFALILWGLRNPPPTEGAEGIV